MVFRIMSKRELEAFLADLKEQVQLEKDSMDEGLGLSLRTNDRRFFLQVRPLKGAELFEITVRTNAEELEQVVKRILSRPVKEQKINGSFLDVVEFIAKLPEKMPQEKLHTMLKKQFNLSEEKIDYFKEMIIRQAKHKNARQQFKQAAQQWQ